MWSFTGSLNIKNNDFYNCTGAPSQANAVTGNPNFVNSSSDWHLSSGSAAAGTGATLSFNGYLSENIDVSVAKDGTRRTTPWDLGIYGSSSGTGTVADTSAPTVPGSLTATAVSSSQINLAWAASSDNVGVAGYRVYRQGTLIATVGAVTSYQNTGLAAGSYGYSVAAFDQAGNVSAQSATVTATTLAAGSALQLGPISPASGTGTNQTFVLTISDSAGSAKLSDVNVMINAALSGGANTCWLHYFAPSNVIQLANDNTQVAPVWRNAVAVGSNLTEQNSQCSLNIAGATAVSAGNTLTLTLPLGFKSTWSGTKNIYVYASDAAGVTAGYTAVGNWTVPAASAGDVSAPSTPTGLAASPASTSGIALTWSASTDNVGVVGYKLYRQGTQVATITGATYYLDTNLSPGSSYSYTLAAYDQAGNTSPQSASVSATTQSIAPGVPIVLGTVSPSSGKGQNQTFTFTVSDSNGYSHISDVNVMINANFGSGANTCWFHYFAPSNVLQLSNDNTPTSLVWQPALAIGSNVTQQNSQCSISFAGVRVTRSGNTLKLTVPITFAPAWTGPKFVFQYGSDTGGGSAGYSAMGTWTVSQ